MRSVEVRHLDSPPKITRPKRIHPRRLLPFVAEGKERGIHSLSPRAFIALRQDAAPDIQVALNTTLTLPAQKQTSSNVNEPSVSVVDDIAFFTGNWYAAISTDGGETWRDAELGEDFGRFAFRVFRFDFVPPRPGRYQVMARANNTIGQTQAEKLIFNPAGYHNNVVRPLTVNAL